MLRGIIERKEISKESFAAKKDQIKEQALKRFIENDSGSDSTLEKVSIKDNTLKSRGKLIRLPWSEFWGKVISSRFPTCRWEPIPEIPFVAFRFVMTRGVLLVREPDF